MTAGTIVERKRGAGAATRQAVADCDIHPAPRTLEQDLYPFLEARWRRHLETFGAPTRSAFQSGTSYPKGQPMASRRDSVTPGGGFPGSDPEFMRKQHLDANNVVLGVMLPLQIGLGLRNPDLGAAICRAMNDWQAETWVAREPRLRASILVSYEDARASVAEIERRAGDRRFVQVQMLSRAAEPLGNRRYWPIYEAAERAGLPIGVHAFGYGGWPVTAGGWPSYYLEDMAAHAQSMQSLLTSMIFEGVFERYPRLKLVLVEGGLAWLPSLTWRLDGLWHRLRSEVPHVTRPPSEYIRESVWLTSQPIEEPANRSHIVDVLDWIGWDRILYASDYPHWDFDDPDRVLPVGVPKDRRQQFFIENAAKLYGIGDG